MLEPETREEYETFLSSTLSTSSESFVMIEESFDGIDEQVCGPAV